MIGNDELARPVAHHRTWEDSDKALSSCERDLLVWGPVGAWARGTYRIFDEDFGGVGFGYRVCSSMHGRGRSPSPETARETWRGDGRISFG